MTVSDPPASPVYARYEDFCAADPRRRGDAYELGADWHDGQHRYRACWYEQSGELTLERLSASEPLAVEDFYHGVQGPVEVLAHIPTRAELSLLLGQWPNIAPGQPRTVTHLRALVARRPRPTATAAPRSPESAA